VVNIQPTQTVFALAADGIRRQRAMNVSLFVPAQTTFGENVWPTSGPGSQRKRDDFLGVAHSINGGRVDPVNAKLEPAMNRGDGRLVILLAPTKLPARSTDSPSAKADWCDE
jgi:hypothetical protein